MANIRPNQEYNRYLYRWQKVRDVLNGEDRLKEIDLSRVGGVVAPNVSVSGSVNQYLRLINPSDKSDYNQDLNRGYIKGAKLFNASDRTLSGMMGMLFRNEPVTPDNLPSSLDYIFENVDGSGTSMSQQARSVSDDVVSIGRDGLLVDMPVSDGSPRTVADVQNGFRATIQEYKAENIYDWHEKVVNGVKILDLLVLREISFESDGDDPLDIKRTEVVKYRVYRLRDDGVTVAVYKENQDSTDIVGDEIPVFFGSSRADRIPFSFVGSKDNKPCIDRLPLEPLVNVNLGDYQESANLSSSAFQFGAAQPFISDDFYAKQARSQDNENEPVKMGEGSIHILGSGGNMAFAAPPENTLSMGMKANYKEEMIALGAQLVSNGGQAETAEAARLNHATDASVLALSGQNVSNAYSKCLEYVALFMGVTVPEDGFKYMLNEYFFDANLTPDEIRSMVELWQAGGISKDVFDKKLIAGKVIAEDEDLEIMNAAIQSEAPQVPMMDLDA